MESTTKIFGAMSIDELTDLTVHLAQLDNQLDGRAAEDGVLEQAGFTKRDADRYREYYAHIKRPDEREQTRRALYYDIWKVLDIAEDSMVSGGTPDTPVSRRTEQRVRILEQAGFYRVASYVLTELERAENVTYIDYLIEYFVIALQANLFDYALYIALAVNKYEVALGGSGVMSVFRALHSICINAREALKANDEKHIEELGEEIAEFINQNIEYDGYTFIDGKDAAIKYLADAANREHEIGNLLAAERPYMEALQQGQL